MADKIIELEKQLVEQDKQIKKLIAAASLSEKRIMALDKKLARFQHNSRNQTNIINSILGALNMRSSR